MRCFSAQIALISKWNNSSLISCSYIHGVHDSTSVKRVPISQASQWLELVFSFAPGQCLGWACKMTFTSEKGVLWTENFKLGGLRATILAVNVERGVLWTENFQIWVFGSYYLGKKWGCTGSNFRISLLWTENFCRIGLVNWL